MATTEKEMLAGKTPTYRLIPLGDLKLGDGPLPDGHLVASVRQHGIFEDILVRPWRDKFKVIAGRRRCLAIQRIATEEDREPTLELLPCKVIEDAEAALAAMVVTNNLGKKNPLADCDAIVSLTNKYVKAGKTQKEITKAITKELRISAATQAKRLKLLSLPVEVRQAICEGTCATSTAEQFHALSPKQVKKLVAMLEENGKLTAKDIKEARQTGIVKHVESLNLWEQVPEVPHAQNQNAPPA
jgi:ParB family chromosome partitioning protein